MKQIAGGIYAILNLMNGKRYIGSAMNLRGRRRDHFCKLRKGIHGNTHLQNAFSKYGDNAFGWIVLDYIEDLEMLVPRENIYLSMFWSTGLLYNHCPMAGSTLGYKFTEEQCRGISESRKGEQNPFYGQHHTAEANRKNSEAHKKENLSERTKRRRRKTMLELWKDEEHRQKMHETYVGFTGKSHSAETKRKMSEARKRWWARKRAEESS